MIPKVFVAAPTSEKKSYILSRYLDNVTNFTYPNKQFYFCDNSPNPNYHFETLLSKGFDCAYVSPTNKKSNQYITESQNILRNKFLESDCEYFLSLEIDLLPTQDIIEILLAEQSVACVANYFIGFGEDSHLLAQEADNTWTVNCDRNLSPAERFIEFGTGKTKLTNAGLGCALIKREIIEQVRFRYNDRVDTHSDGYFWVDVRDLGYELKVIDLIIEHHNQKWTSNGQ